MVARQTRKKDFFKFHTKFLFGSHVMTQYIMVVNHIGEEIGRPINVLVINLESNLRSDAGALTRSLVRNVKIRRGDKQKANLG